MSRREGVGLEHREHLLPIVDPLTNPNRIFFQPFPLHELIHRLFERQESVVETQMAVCLCHQVCIHVAIAKRAGILERFGARVRELRKEPGHSQEGFAAACGLDRTDIGGIERGKRNLALRNFGVIAQSLGITFSELMDGL